jgi:hypothetical protein
LRQRLIVFVKPMMTKIKKRIIIIIILLIVLALGIFAGDVIYEAYRVRQMIIDDVHEREAAFHQKPDLLHALVLMDKYFWDFKQYEKANYYADYCIKLDVEKTNRGWYVHMVKADIASRNKDIKQACDNLQLALQLADQYKIREGQIKPFKYQDLLNTCTARGMK